MKYIRYFSIALVVGGGFGAGAILVLIFIVPKIGDYQVAEMHSDRIASEEKEIGMTCVNLYEQTMEFSNIEISRSIDVGLDDGDWVAVFNVEQREYIADSAEHIFYCQLLSHHANELGIEWPSFKKLFELYSALNTFTTSYSGKAPSAGSLKPEAFEKVMSLYRNVTSQGSEGASRQDKLTLLPA